MSEIAKALANAAKITESANLQQAHQKSAAALRKNHTREFIWGGVLSCVCLIVLGAFLVHSADTLTPAVIRTQTSAETHQAAETNEPKLANPVLEAQLANLAINGLIKSPNLRVLIGARVIELGDELFPGLILSGIDERDLIATDAQGLTYRKKL
jgi:hypothetical protein